MTALGDVLFTLRGDASSLVSEFGKGEAALASFSQKAESTKSSLSGMKEVVVAASVGAGAALADLGDHIAHATVGFNSMLQNYQIQFQTFMGSATQASAHLKDLASFSDSFGLNVDSVMQASAALEQFGGKAIDTKQALTEIANASAATGQPINSLANQLGTMYQMLGSGQMSAQRLVRELINMRLITAGQADELVAMSNAGYSQSAMWQQLMQDMNKFAGAAAAQANTWAGLKNSIHSLFEEDFATAFQPVFTSLQNAMSKVKEFLGGSSQWAGTNNAMAAVATGIAHGIDSITNSFEKLAQHINVGGGIDKLVEDLSKAKGAIGALAGVWGATLAELAKGIPILGKMVPDMGFLEGWKGGLLGVLLASNDTRHALENLAEAVMKLLGASGGILAVFAGLVNALTPIAAAVINTAASFVRWIDDTAPLRKIVEGLAIGFLGLVVAIKAVDGIKTSFAAMRAVIAVIRDDFGAWMGKMLGLSSAKEPVLELNVVLDNLNKTLIEINGNLATMETRLAGVGGEAGALGAVGTAAGGAAAATGAKGVVGAAGSEMGGLGMAGLSAMMMDPAMIAMIIAIVAAVMLGGGKSGTTIFNPGNQSAKSFDQGKDPVMSEFNADFLKKHPELRNDQRIMAMLNGQPQPGANQGYTGSLNAFTRGADRAASEVVPPPPPPAPPDNTLTMAQYSGAINLLKLQEQTLSDTFNQQSAAFQVSQAQRTVTQATASNQAAHESFAYTENNKYGLADPFAGMAATLAVLTPAEQAMGQEWKAQATYVNNLNQELTGLNYQFQDLQNQSNALSAQLSTLAITLQRPLEGTKAYNKAVEDNKEKTAAVQQQLIDAQHQAQTPEQLSYEAGLKNQIAQLNQQGQSIQNTYTTGLGAQQFNVAQAQLPPEVTYQDQLKAAQATRDLTVRQQDLTVKMNDMKPTLDQLQTEFDRANTKLQNLQAALQQVADTDNQVTQANESLASAINNQTIAKLQAEANKIQNVIDKQTAQNAQTDILVQSIIGAQGALNGLSASAIAAMTGMADALTSLQSAGGPGLGVGTAAGGHHSDAVKSPQALNDISSALSMLGIPVNMQSVNAIQDLVMNEDASFDPNARNPNGGATGIMQVKPGTYADAVAWARAHGINLDPNGITNPVDNIVAGIIHLITTWAGGNFNALVPTINKLLDPSNPLGNFKNGVYQGYDSGGILTPGVTTAYNATGQDEYVLTHAQLMAVARGDTSAVNMHSPSLGRLPSSLTDPRVMMGASALYDSGGVLKPGVTTAHNNTGGNEFVLTPTQLAALTGGITVQLNFPGGMTEQTPGSGRFSSGPIPSLPPSSFDFGSIAAPFSNALTDMHSATLAAGRADAIARNTGGQIQSALNDFKGFYTLGGGMVGFGGGVASGNSGAYTNTPAGLIGQLQGAGGSIANLGQFLQAAQAQQTIGANAGMLRGLGMGDMLQNYENTAYQANNLQQQETALQESIDSATASIAPQKEALDNLTASYNVAQAQMSLLQDKMKEYQDVANQPLKGTLASTELQQSDQNKANQIQYQIAQLQLGGAFDQDPRIVALNYQLKFAQAQSQSDQLNTALTLGVQQQQIQDTMAKGKPEVDFKAALSAADSYSQVADKAYTAQQNLDAMKTSVDQANLAYQQANEPIVDMQNHLSTLQAQAKPLTDALDEINGALSQLAQELATAVANGTPLPGILGQIQAMGGGTPQGTSGGGGVGGGPGAGTNGGPGGSPTIPGNLSALETQALQRVEEFINGIVGFDQALNTPTSMAQAQLFQNELANGDWLDLAKAGAFIESQPGAAGDWGMSPGATAQYFQNIAANFAPGGLWATHDEGGWWQPGHTALNMTGKPEAVLTAEQWNAIKSGGGMGRAGTYIAPNAVCVTIRIDGGLVGTDAASYIAQAAHDAATDALHNVVIQAQS